MIIETVNLTKTYGDKVGCAGICLSVDRGQIFGFLGPNGAGKSTLVKMLVGLLVPSSGSAQLLGRPLGNLRARQKIGFLPENFRYQPWLTAEELLSFHAALARMGRVETKERIPAVLKQVGLSEKVRQRVGTFSKGMQQRLGLACALLSDPDLIFLDEPTSALDPLGRREVRQIMLELRQQGKTVFLNSHLLSEVELVCDRVEIINNGRIIAGGTLDELLAQSIEVEMEVDGITTGMLAELESVGVSVKVQGNRISLSVKNREQLPALAAAVVNHAGRLFALETKQRSLEDLYVSLIKEGDGEQC